MRLVKQTLTGMFAIALTACSVIDDVQEEDLPTMPATGKTKAAEFVETFQVGCLDHYPNVQQVRSSFVLLGMELARGPETGWHDQHWSFVDRDRDLIAGVGQGTIHWSGNAGGGFDLTHDCSVDTLLSNPEDIDEALALLSVGEGPESKLIVTDSKGFRREAFFESEQGRFRVFFYTTQRIARDTSGGSVDDCGGLNACRLWERAYLKIVPAPLEN